MEMEQKLIEESVSIVEKLRGGIQKPARIPHNHINALYVLREEMGDKCKNYLEIGTLWGSSMLTAMQSEHKCNFYGIDLFGHFLPLNATKPRDMLSVESTSKIIDSLNKHGHEYQLFKGDSSSDEMISNIKDKIKGGVDLFFVDGDHTTEGGMKDFNNYKDLMNSGGYIVFDDYGFIKEVRDGVDSMDFEGFEVVGRIPSSVRNSNMNWPNYVGNNENACFIIKKK
jgi:predicted O-methyltransferase YrrM